MTAERRPVSQPRHFELEPVAFAGLPGWADDQHWLALAAYRMSSPHVDDLPTVPAELVRLSGVEPDASSRARAFFERFFIPHRVVHDGEPGFLTGYYEPVYDGARQRSERFCVPVHRRPADLVTLVPEAERGARADERSHARRTASGALKDYPSRADIEAGALDGQGLELLWLADPVDLFFMQVQGSGRIRLDDGSFVRLTYDGKNGHPYTSIGRALIERGDIPAAAMSLATLRAWLIADRARGRAAMQLNRSYVFFRALDEAREPGPLGVMGTQLVPGRSLAVDTAFHRLGQPIWVSAPGITHLDGRPLARLMVAHDVGSAIRGPERGDIYFGSGPEAGERAGITKHTGSFFVLLPLAHAGARARR